MAGSRAVYGTITDDELLCRYPLFRAHDEKTSPDSGPGDFLLLLVSVGG
jgi:hypothetical protein